MDKQADTEYRNEIIEMARQAGFVGNVHIATKELEAFAKLVAAKAVAKDREEFDIDGLCASQNKIGYKQGYRAGQLAEREACAKVCDELETLSDADYYGYEFSKAIRARGKPTSRGDEVT